MHKPTRILKHFMTYKINPNKRIPKLKKKPVCSTTQELHTKINNFSLFILNNQKQQLAEGKKIFSINNLQ